VAENMPVWLLAMEKDYCTTIHVVAHSSPGKFLKTMRQKNIDPHLVNIAVNPDSCAVIRSSCLVKTTRSNYLARSY
jgi:hypothetical protein